MPVRYFARRDPHNDSLSIVKNDRHWHAAQLCDQEKSSGNWLCNKIATPPPTEPLEIQNAEHPEQQSELAKKIAPSLVWVSFRTPYAIDEIGTGISSGSGLIVDAKQGLVVVDRTTVPSIVGEVMMTFAGSIKIPAEVIFIHPLHNLALLKYNPEFIGTTPVSSAKLSTQEPGYGEKIYVAGTNYNYQILVQTRKVSTYGPLKIAKSSLA